MRSEGYGACGTGIDVTGDEPLFRKRPVSLAKSRLGKSDVPSGTSRPPQKAPKKIWMKTVPHDKKEKKRPKTTFLEKADQKKREKQLTQLAKKDNET